MFQIQLIRRTVHAARPNRIPVRPDPESVAPPRRDFEREKLDDLPRLLVKKRPRRIVGRAVSE